MRLVASSASDSHTTWKEENPICVLLAVTGLCSCPTAPPSTPSRHPTSRRLPTKRESETVATPSPKCRQNAHNTPTRRTLAGIHPGEGSPAVVVSHVMGANFVEIHVHVYIYHYVQ